MQELLTINECSTDRGYCPLYSLILVKYQKNAKFIVKYYRKNNIIGQP